MSAAESPIVAPGEAGESQERLAGSSAPELPSENTAAERIGVRRRSFLKGLAVNGGGEPAFIFTMDKS